MLKCTAFLALAIEYGDDVDLGPPGVDGVINSIASVKIPSNSHRGYIDLPVHAVKNITKAKFVDFVSRRAAELYDSLVAAAPDAKTKPLSNLAADPRIRSHLAKVSQSLMTSDPHPPGEESK